MCGEHCSAWPKFSTYASKKGIRIGIENREHYEAVPSEREFEDFLQRLNEPNVGYWHDFGHAQIKQNLALLDHADWLDRMGSRALGCHVHDVKWPFEDHCAPFTGEINYEKLVPKLPKDCLFVFELRPLIPREQIVAAADRWRKLFRHMKRILFTSLQVAITLFLLWWIFRDPEKRAQMAVALRAADYLWLIPGVLSIGCAFLLQTERWRLLLSVQGIDLGWWRTFRVYLIGAFFNLFLLGATGGDIVKIYYAMRETSSKKTAALLSVLVDRMVGMLALVAITVVLCSLRLDRLLADPLTRALMAALPNHGRIRRHHRFRFLRGSIPACAEVAALAAHARKDRRAFHGFFDLRAGSPCAGLHIRAVRSRAFLHFPLVLLCGAGLRPLSGRRRND